MFWVQWRVVWRVVCCLGWAGLTRFSAEWRRVGGWDAVDAAGPGLAPRCASRSGGAGPTGSSASLKSVSTGELPERRPLPDLEIR